MKKNKKNYSKFVKHKDFLSQRVPLDAQRSICFYDIQDASMFWSGHHLLFSSVIITILSLFVVMSSVGL